MLVSVSGFGQTGPLATRAGYDRIGLAFSGVMAATGEENGMPVRVGINQRTAENVAHAYEECVARVRRMDRPLIAGSVGGGAWAVDAVIE